MNADYLLEGLDLLGDGPATIQQFRKLVIVLAMTGKLNAPDHQYLDPQTLANAVDERKRAVLPKGGVQDRVSSSTALVDDLPRGFSNPQDFTRLGAVARIEKGRTGIMKAKPGQYPLVVTAEGRASCDHYDFTEAAAIVPLVSSAGHGKASLQRLHYQEGRFALGSILAAIFPHAPDLISARFLYEYLTAFKDELLVTRMIGTANVSLSVGKLSEVPVPLVAPTIQRRIDQLMTLCDKLEAGRAEREVARDRLTTMSLARLNKPDPDTFQEDARFALDSLPALTTRLDQIGRLRQAVFNLAVSGKLVSQDTNDESVSLPTASCDELPASLPAKWRYSRLANLLSENTRNGYSRKPDNAKDGTPILRISAGTIRRDGIVAEEEHKLISGINRETQDEYGLRSGDLLACRFNGNKAFVGRLSIFNDYSGIRPIFPDKLIRIRVASRLALPSFLRMASDTDIVRREVEAVCATTVGNWGISAANLRDVRFPLPPLAEQRRIVAKVDELLALCDQLAAAVALGLDTRHRFLESLLYKALTPAVERAA